MANYTSQYPPAHNGTYVKATTYNSVNYYQYFATNPALSLIDSPVDVQWYAAAGITTNQRFHIDLGTSRIIRRIYYENGHNAGTITNRGVRAFTFWGSNIGAGSFDDLVYANDEGWTQLTAATAEFDQHVAANQADPKYILVTNGNSYRYYAFKFATIWGSTDSMGLRHVNLMTEDGYPPGGFSGFSPWIF